MKKIIVYVIFLFASYLLVLPEGLFCMGSLDKIGNNNDNSEENVLNLLKKIENSKKADFFIEFSRAKLRLSGQLEIGNCFARGLVDEEDIGRFFSFKMGRLKAKKLKIQPFDSPSYSDLYDEEIARSAPQGVGSDSLMGKSLRSISKMVFSNNNFRDGNSMYLMEVSNSSVEIIKRSTNKAVFSKKVDGNINKIGARIYFDRNIGDDKGICCLENVLLVFSGNQKSVCYSVCLYDKDAKVIFETNTDKKICFYKIFEFERFKFIALVFENSVDLFSIDKMEKIATINCQNKAPNCFFKICNDEIFFSADKIINLINKEKKIKTYSFDSEIVSGLSYLNYMIFTSKKKNDYFVNFFNKKSAKIIGSFSSSSGDTFGLHEKDDELYFWTRDSFRKVLKIYSIFEEKVESIFEKRFKEPICKFDLEMDKDKPVCVEFLGSGRKSYKLLASSDWN